MAKKGIITGQRVNPKKQQRARELRRSMTPAERSLWGRLRANRLDGWHFRRQQIIAGFIVDFYCHKACLVIEVDGPIHDRRKIQDEARTEILCTRGLKVIRFSNREVMNDLQGVLRTIREHLPTPQLPPKREGESDY